MNLSADDRFEDETRPVYVNMIQQARATAKAMYTEEVNVWHSHYGEEDPLASLEEPYVDPALSIYHSAAPSLRQLREVYQAYRYERSVLALNLILSDYRYLERPVAKSVNTLNGDIVLSYVPIPDNPYPGQVVEEMMAFAARHRLLMQLDQVHGEVRMTFRPAERLVGRAA